MKEELFNKDDSLSHSIIETWDYYEKQVYKSRDKISAKNIHKLRVSTQRLEAILTLANHLKSNHNSKNAIFLIKKVRKSLGPLRDIQVKSKAINGLKQSQFSSIKSAEFSKFFANQKKSAKKKAHKCLDQISLINERQHIQKLTEKLVKVEAYKSQTQIQEDLDQKVKSSLSKLNKMMTHLNPKHVQDIHQFRIHVKKVRYQEEFLNSLYLSPKYDLGNLKAAQSITGQIQNDSILIKTLDRFLSKKKHADVAKALSFRKQIATSQAELINTDFKKLRELTWENHEK